MLSSAVNDKRKSQRVIALVLGLVFLLAAIIFSMVAGVIPLTLDNIARVIMPANSTDELYRIVHLLRLPRTIVAALVGANLALAGCVLQGILRNPLADPGIIGVSAGAGLMAMLLMILVPEKMALVPFAAFLGALAATTAVFFLAWERGINPLKMILAGVAIAAFFGGGMSALMVFFADRIQGTVTWMAGGFQGRSWNHVQMILPYSIIGILGTLFCYRELNALQLGEEVATSIGINVKRIRTILIILAALLAASAVSVAGMIGFVGLIVPHITRLVVGSDCEYLLPCAAIFGAALVTFADTVARTAFSPIEVPVGIFMAFLGAPFFLYLLKRRMRT
ncbi:MAG TPA: iron ABC transporter permease [Candidatus Avacidaminococcus intestinavium]|uniref:Iron ABC transporter permease n=1 Tax=Candidatus Avacidaminococcus intestinavium TaxID=2840684 RepID=A0A9D1SLS6_9FIRM|nr:iron ABC transporter permease [Candidatus Avacidaminococcus intestinavium]